MYGSPNQSPSALSVGAVILGTIVVLLFLRTCTNQDESQLMSHFAAAEATTVANQSDGILPKPVQNWSETAIAKLQGGQAVVPVTPEIESSELNVDIQSMQVVGTGLQIKGTVTNVSNRELKVPLAGFKFIDQTGTIYAAQSDAAVTLPPGSSTPLELTLPIENPTKLTMQVSIPEESIQMEMDLLVSSD